MAAVFTADYEGLYSIHRKAVGVVYDSAQQNRKPHRKEQMDGKDKLLWRHSAFARPCHFMGVRGMLPLLQPNVLNNRAMDSSLNGRTAGGRTRKAFKLKEFFCSGVNRGLDLIVVQCGLWDYEHKQQRGLLSGPGRQLH